MKTPIELRQHILTAIGADLLGTRTYGNVTEPAISIIPDPQFGDGGMAFPSIINGTPVTYQGIEAVIYDGYEANEYTPLLANESQLDKETWILLKDWSGDDTANITMAAHKVSKGLDVIETRTPPANPVDQAPLLRSIILVVAYSARI